jgi:serine/threonine protein phosphatase PrpC
MTTEDGKSEHEAAGEWRAVLSRPLAIDEFLSAAANVDIEVAALSDCGAVETNTDHYLALRLGRVQETLATSLQSSDLPRRYEEYAYAMVVADGLGDQGAGARASRVALSTLAHLAIRYGKWNVRVSPETSAEIRQQGEFLYRETNEAIIRASREDIGLIGMATSLTAVYIAGTDLFFAHTGHSKAFLFRNGALIALTGDQKNVITEALGNRSGGPMTEIEHVQLWSDDRILLCTNGLTDVVDEEHIADVLALRRHPNPDCRRLVDLALSAGGPDNITVLLANFRVGPARPETHSLFEER